MSGTGITGDLEDCLGVTGFAIYELVRYADFEEAAMHHQSTHRSPALRTWVRPQQNCFPGSCVIADRRDQMRCPHPGPGEEDDDVDVVVELHLLQSAARLVFRGDHRIVLDDFHASLHEGRFGSLDDGVVDEGSAHGIFQSVFVNAVHDEPDCRLNQASSSSVTKNPSACCTAADRSCR